MSGTRLSYEMERAAGDQEEIDRLRARNAKLEEFLRTIMLKPEEHNEIMRRDFLVLNDLELAFTFHTTVVELASEAEELLIEEVEP